MTNVQEKLLHYIWKHRIFPLHPLRTVEGRDVEVIDPGMSHADAGPDFFNAKVRIDGTVWAGNVEIHLSASDWYKHGHQADARYNNVILHVVTSADCSVQTQDGRSPLQLVLPIPDALRHGYQELLNDWDYPRCHRLVSSFPAMLVHSWMDALLVERLRERSDKVLARLEEVGGDWSRTLMVTLARNFGFSLNGDVFERWGYQLPLPALGKHRDDLLQVQALMVGTAGLLPQVRDERMAREYAYLAHKFNLTSPMEASQWRYLRTRPQNFPHVRILQLAQLFQRGTIDLSRLLETERVDDLRACFALKGLSPASIDLLLINTVVPVLYAYGRSHHQEHLQARAIALLEALKAENNRILRQWSDCGLSVTTAADSQALIQLKRAYCDRHDCLRCRFGYAFLQSSATAFVSESPLEAEG